MIYQLLAGLIAAIVLSVSFFTFGVRYESGQNAKREKANIEAAIEQTRTEMKTQETLAVKAAEVAAEKRYKARGVQSEIAKLPVRTECDWTSDEQRLLNDLYRSYFNAPANPTGLQDQMRESTRTAKPTLLLGTGDGGMGLRVQIPTR